VAVIQKHRGNDGTLRIAGVESGGQLEVEVGYVLGAASGSGFATKPRYVSDYGMDRLGFDRLIAIILPQNTASQRSPRKWNAARERPPLLKICR